MHADDGFYEAVTAYHDAQAAMGRPMDYEQAIMEFLLESHSETCDDPRCEVCTLELGGN